VILSQCMVVYRTFWVKRTDSIYVSVSSDSETRREGERVGRTGAVDVVHLVYSGVMEDVYRLPTCL